MSGYVLTQQVIAHAERLAAGLRTNSGQRAWRITGDYGSGKSSFALLLAHMLSGKKAHLPSAVRDAIDFKKLGIDTPRLLPILVTGSPEPLSVALLRSLRRDLVAVAGFNRNAKIVQAIDIALSLSSSTKASVADAKVIELVTDACSQLVETKRGTGLLILLDELGKFLEYGAFHPEQQDVFPPSTASADSLPEFQPSTAGCGVAASRIQRVLGKPIFVRSERMAEGCRSF